MYVCGNLFIIIIFITITLYSCIRAFVFVELLNYFNFLLFNNYIVVAYSLPFFIAGGHLLPDILDFMEPLNQSRSHQLLILAEYFVDNEKYFYLIVLYITLCFFLFQITLMSTTSIYIMYIQHMCSMFQIAR